jgi:hypothetical protein
MMRNLDFFSGASERWREQAALRARRVLLDHRDNAMSYVERRLKRSRFGSF